MSATTKKPVETITGNGGRIVGTACGECGIFYSAKGNVDHVERAETCCKPHICKQCGGESQKWHTLCRGCAHLKRLGAWQAKPDTRWDGSFPVMVWNDDQYLFDEDQLLEYVHELEGGWEDMEVEACDPVVPRSFDVHQFLADDFAEDGEMEGDWNGFNDTVNDWIKKHFPKTYIGNGERITVDVRLRYESAKAEPTT